ncbi:autoinducer binding domain-containing protein [Ruegeria sp. EL01]|uniref:helix-turn-helix transcriptional regulator n=1 Tax=Ruegeria sp. EL01 TaxID=2107578 RepID=UPI0013C4B71B|nr:autoinducer binding domain-containing protein [Ruegeria sp. EL01]
MTSTLQLLGDELTKIGFERYAIGTGFHTGELDFTSTFDDQWQKFYFVNNFQKLDPLPYCALAGETPLRWSDIHKRMKKNPVMNAARDFGLKQGFGLSCGGYVVSAYHDGEVSDSDLSFVQSSMARIVQRSEVVIEPLTKSQQGLVDLLGVGLPMAQIAEILGVTPDGLKTAKRRLFKKYQVNSDAQLLRVLRNQ